MDKKAKNILFRTYWKNGWIDNEKRTADPADFLYAKEKGLMFDPLTISYDDCVKKIIEVSTKITIEQVAKAFLSSLSTRRLDWRSGISSYFIAKLFLSHKYTPIISGHFHEDGKIVHSTHTCQICRDLKYGIVGNEFYKNEGLNVLNFERIKWGRVRHGDLIYTFFDLEQFGKEKITEPTKDEYERFTKNSVAGGNVAAFIRSIIHIDRKVAEKRFSQFLSDVQLNSEQQEYLITIINYVNENGDITTDILINESPFDSFDWQKIFGNSVTYIPQYVNLIHSAIRA